jgi:NAD+ synthase
MTSSTALRIACVQENPVVGDIEGNLEIVRKRRAEWNGKADLVVFSECFVTGYPLEDLVARPGFLRDVRLAVDAFAEEMATTDGPAVLIGAPIAATGKPYNAAILIDNDGSSKVVLKHILPNDEVYDEVRVFESGPMPKPVEFRDMRLGVLICEDFWHGHTARALADEGADAIVVINGSHFKVGKQARREELARRVAADVGLPVLYVNQVGGQDELVFDGGSFAMTATGSVVHRTAFCADSFAVTLSKGRIGASLVEEERGMTFTYPDRLEAMYAAMVIGLRDYVEKNGFPGVVLGMSGGIDSAISAAVAVDALGPDRVRLVMMPSPYTSRESLDDAAAAAGLLGAAYDVVPIGPAMEGMRQMLAPLFAGRAEDVTEENLQARIRGMVLMAVSNKFGPMVLSTGNKSEMSVGYATLYGDMCGGYSVLKDVYKTDVFALCRWRNAAAPAAWLGAKGPRGPVMPERIITKPPTAELKEGQTDEAALGSYDVLDAVLRQMVEGLADPKTAARTASRDLGVAVDEAYAQRIAKLTKRAEYKRRQAPPGVSLTPRNFGRGWRFPITSGYTG